MPQAALKCGGTGTLKCGGSGKCPRGKGRPPCGAHCACAIRKAGYRLCRHIVLYSALVIVAIANIVALVAFQLRQSALDAGRANAANFSAAFEEQAHSALDGIAGAMEHVKQRIETEGDSFNLPQWAQSRLAGQPIQVAATGPDGRIRAGAFGKKPEPTDLSAEDYFRVQRDNPNAGFFIGKPVPGSDPKQVTIPLSRRLEKPGGGFAGVLVFSVDPDFLISLHRSIDLGSNGIMALAGLDTIVRTAHWGASNGAVRPGAPIPGALSIPGAAHAQAGAYVAQSPLDGVTRLFDWRKVQGYPLMVIVGLDRAECLAVPNRLALIILGLGAAAVLLSGALAAMVVQEISNRVRYEIEVNDHAADLNEANQSLTVQHEALVKTASELARERVNLQEINSKLLLAQQQSEAANHAKSAFLANMSHELRTPLNAIIGFSEIIRDKLLGPDSPAYFEYAGDINSAGLHLLAIVNDVLDLAKIEAGKVEFYETVADLGGILGASIRAVKTQAKSGDVKILKEFPPDGIQVRCDELRLKQVFINVLSNAVKFTPSGGHVGVSATLEDGGGLCIAIKDTGIGMTPEEIVAAFEKFRQIDNSLTKRFEGTGLGLPLAKQFTELHGGTVEVVSEPSVGTEVRIRLPAERVESTAPKLAGKRSPVAALTYAGNAEERPAQPAAA